MQKKIAALESSAKENTVAINRLMRHKVNIIDVSAQHERPIKLSAAASVYCAVFLRDVKRKEAIPTKWIKSFDSVKAEQGT